MEWVTVRFAGGPADGTARELPAAPGGGPPRRWVLSTSPDGFRSEQSAAADPDRQDPDRQDPDRQDPDRQDPDTQNPDTRSLSVDHLYELRPQPEADGCWTMSFVRSDPVGMTE